MVGNLRPRTKENHSLVNRMDYPPCFNTYNNINYRQRSQTLQPIRGDALAEIPNPNFMIAKYLTSQLPESERANYANVPLEDPEEILFMQQQQPRHLHSRPHQHVHSRSHSHHYYHTMCQANDLQQANYYNLSNVGTTIIPARSTRHPSPINEPQPMHNQLAKLDKITLMQVCAELGNIDSPPPMPSSRNYTISGSREEGLYKITFPQRRYIKGHYLDPITGVSLAPGSIVSVLGPLEGDPSKFTVCYNDQHIDLPNTLTDGCQPLRH